MVIKRIPYKGQELLPAKRDLIFKALFATGSDLELLASLLSSILDVELQSDSLIVTNAELAPVHEKGKLSRIDVRVRLSDGKQINIEIQLRNEHDMKSRSIFYLSKLYVEQLAPRMEFIETNPVIAVNILDFKVLPDKEYHNRYRLKNMRNNEELTDLFEINFLELSKIPPEPDGSMKDLWMRFLSAKTEEELDMLAEKSPVLEKAVHRLVQISADEKLRYELEMREKAEIDYWSAMKTNYRKGEEKGIKKGRKEGRLEGIEQGKLAIAENMLKRNRPIDEIIEDTGLTRKQVEGLRKPAAD